MSDDNKPTHSQSTPVCGAPAVRKGHDGRHTVQRWVVCSCGPLEGYDGRAVGTHCPLGMPWHCFRQLELPFNSVGPTEKR